MRQSEKCHNDQNYSKQYKSDQNIQGNMAFLSEDCNTMFTYKFLYGVVYTKDRIAVFRDIGINIKFYTLLNKFHSIRRAEQDESGCLVNPFYLHGQLINHFELFLSIMKPKNCHLAEFLLLILFQFI